MEMGKRRDKSKICMVSVALLMCLLMAGNVSATDGTTFPVDEAGIAAYVKVSESIDLEATMNNLLPHISDIIEVNTTYFIVNVTNDDSQITHLYVGADGWVIPYYLRTENVSKIVRWNITSTQDPTPQSVIDMTTLEEAISKTCAAIGVDYETIKSEIKFYDFEHPDANRMMIAIDMVTGEGSDSFYMVIPSEVTLKESSYSHLCIRYCASGHRVNGIPISEISGTGQYVNYGNYNLPIDQRNTISIANYLSNTMSGVGWVVIYRTY